MENSKSNSRMMALVVLVTVIGSIAMFYSGYWLGFRRGVDFSSLQFHILNDQLYEMAGDSIILKMLNEKDYTGAKRYVRLKIEGAYGHVKTIRDTVDDKDIRRCLDSPLSEMEALIKTANGESADDR